MGKTAPTTSGAAHRQSFPFTFSHHDVAVKNITIGDISGRKTGDDASFPCEVAENELALVATTHMPQRRRLRELEEQVRSLKSENEKLRLVEEQFWALLKENEELRSAARGVELSSVMKRDSERDTNVLALGPSDGAEMWSHSSCLRALRECMDIVLARELGGMPQCDQEMIIKRQLEREDSVASYLLWLRTKQQKGKVNINGIHSRGRDDTIVTAVAVAGSSPSHADEGEVSLLRSRLEGAEFQLKETSEMLQLVNASRAKALEDCSRMSEQVSTLAMFLQDALKSQKEAREVFLENEALNTLVEKQTREIKTRDQLLADMRTMLQQLRAERSGKEISRVRATERPHRHSFTQQSVALHTPITSNSL